MLFWEPFGLEGGWSREGSALGGSARWVPFNGADAITVFHQSSFLFRECLDQNVRPLCHGVNLARFGAWTRSAVRARHLTSFHISRGLTTPQATWLRTPASPPCQDGGWGGKKARLCCLLLELAWWRPGLVSPAFPYFQNLWVAVNALADTEDRKVVCRLWKGLEYLRTL